MKACKRGFVKGLLDIIHGKFFNAHQALIWKHYFSTITK